MITDSHHSFQRLGGQTIFCCGDVPGGIEPSGQWRSRFVKNRSGGNGTLMSTSRTDQPFFASSPRLPPISVQLQSAICGLPTLSILALVADFEGDFKLTDKPYNRYFRNVRQDRRIRMPKDDR